MPGGSPKADVQFEISGWTVELAAILHAVSTMSRLIGLHCLPVKVLLKLLCKFARSGTRVDSMSTTTSVSRRHLYVHIMQSRQSFTHPNIVGEDVPENRYAWWPEAEALTHGWTPIELRLLVVLPEIILSYVTAPVQRLTRRLFFRV